MTKPFGERIGPQTNENDPQTFEEFSVTVTGLYAIAKGRSGTDPKQGVDIAQVANALDQLDELSFVHPGWMNRYFEETSQQQAS